MKNFMTSSGMTALFILLLFLSGCSKSNPEAPAAGNVHPANWQSGGHQAAGKADLNSCQVCHGVDFKGSGKAISCFTCHSSGPPFALHPSWWNGDALAEHQHFHNAFNPAERLSWTSCATAACHGTALKGGSGSAPSCFSGSFVNGSGATNSCHASGPPAPHTNGVTYANPALHGADAKDTGNINESMGNYCINCHGRPTHQFDGGFVADPAILNNPSADCSSCHSDATAHPTNWVRDNNPTRYHSTVSSQTINASCALCHSTSSLGIGPMAGAPSCFSANFTNANSIASSCHDTGPGGAPHVVPFTDPALHGPAAKADLTYCQTCHADPGGQGSNPRFNIPIGSLANGCEGCHTTASAHPTGSDRWTFNLDPAEPRRTHFAAGNALTACALCHNVSAGNVGGTAPLCTSCHVSAPLFRLKCNVCHGNPPIGAADLTGAGTPVDHGGVGTIAAHEECALCHGSKDDGSGKLAAKAAEYLLFTAGNAALNQGGDHLDGQLEMNGPSGVGAGYNATNFGCDNACHGNNLTHRLPNASGLPREFGNYGSGSLACNSCHGYPPDGTADLTGATPVDHLSGDLGATLKANHNDCLLCHGTKDDGTGSHSPAANYSVAIDHGTGSINMNSATQYNETNFGCDLACHGNDASHRLSNSALPVVFADYGGGGGASCAGCHDTGVGGAPIVIQNVTAHASVLSCEECHTGHNAGPVHIPNNTAVGINYTAAGHGNGISLGGVGTSGTSEAEICWNCHASFAVSEWGTNSDTNGAAANYNFGTLNQSSWVGATWSSANFSYKNGAIASTHAVDGSAAAPGLDPVANLRCTYCHDVHDLNLAPGDASSGKPYLRGAWMGNPYREDGAPRSTNSYLATLDRFGAVPRGSTARSELGGYQIDQNNGNPTTGWTLASSAGLCTLCHGTDVDNLNQFGSPGTDWVGVNGHSNAVIGGTGANARNIFTTTDRNPGGVTTGRNGAGNPSMAYLSAKVDGRGYGFRSTAGDPEGWNLNPRMNNSSRPYGFNSYNWGATVDAATIDSSYHKFSCSKCHNPHASRLPRLMISNCLDTNHNTWDTKAGVDLLPATGTANSDGNSTIGVDNGGLPFSSATSAQNCHRRRDSQYPNSRGAGWNKITPWVEF